MALSYDLFSFSSQLPPQTTTSKALANLPSQLYTLLLFFPIAVIHHLNCPTCWFLNMLCNCLCSSLSLKTFTFSSKFKKIVFIFQFPAYVSCFLSSPILRQVSEFYSSLMEQYSFVCIYHSLFTHSFGSFYIWSTVNNAAMNIHMQVSFRVPVFKSLG